MMLLLHYSGNKICLSHKKQDPKSILILLIDGSCSFWIQNVSNGSVKPLASKIQVSIHLLVKIAQHKL